MRLILFTLFRPAMAASLIAARPRWLVQFLMLSLLTMLLSLVLYPHAVSDMLARLPPTASREDRELVVTTLTSELPARLAFLPIRLFIGWSSFALVVLYLAKWFEPRNIIGFRQILSLEVHSEAITVVASCVMAVSIVAGVEMPLSLNALVGGTHSLLQESILKQANVFSLWQIIVQGVALSHLCGYGTMKAFCVVVLSWIIVVSFHVGVVQVLVDKFHLL